MIQILAIFAVLVLAVVATVSAYRLIVSDGGGARRSPLPAEPSEGNTILPYPRGRRSQGDPDEDVLAERLRVRQLRGAQYLGGRVNA